MSINSELTPKCASKRLKKRQQSRCTHENEKLFDISFQEACDKYLVNRGVASRWLNHPHNPLSFVWKPLPSQRLGKWVNEPEFQLRANARDLEGAVASRFFNRCLNTDADPVHTLLEILKFPSWRSDGEMFYDADLARAAIKLVLDPGSDFLSFLTTALPLDGEFASEIARLIEPNRAFAADGSDQDPRQFCDLWKLCIKEVRQGWGSTIPGTFAVERDFLHDGRPEYLSRVMCTSVPDWALKSVVPFKVSKQSNVSKALRRMEQLAEKNLELAGHLPTVVAAITELKPRGVTEDESAASIDLAANHGISALAKQLAMPPFLVPEADAVEYCIAVFCRVHRDIRYDIKRQAAGEQPVKPGPLPYSAANRIFCLSRSAGS